MDLHWFWFDRPEQRITYNIHHLCSMVLPANVQRLTIELINLSRNTEALEYVADKLGGYQFSRQDSNVLAPSQISRSTWEGSSIWHDLRWARDEDDTKPVRLSFATVKRDFVVDKTHSACTSILRDRAIVAPPEIHDRTKYTGPELVEASFYKSELEELGFDDHRSTPASQIHNRINNYVNREDDPLLQTYMYDTSDSGSFASSTIY